MTNYFYVRHGQSKANVDRVVGGWTDVELTEEGIREANEAGEKILQSKLSFDRIVSSPLSRAHVTAKIIAEKIGYPISDIETHDGLKEKSGGKFELRPIEEFYGMSDEELAVGGAETAIAFRDRIVDVSCDIHERTKHLDSVLIVAHAGVYKIATAIVNHRVPTHMYKVKSPPNATMLPFPLEYLTTVDINN